MSWRGIRGTMLHFLSDPAAFANREIWRALAPALHVEDENLIARATEFPVDRDLARDVTDAIMTEGYFQRDPPEWGLPIPAMTDLVRHLAANGLPPVLVFQYDEFWLMFARLHGIITAVLGDDYLILPAFWAWHVDPANCESGWVPHRDKGRISLFEDNRPKALTVWLPLNDATPLNGCMYVVPSNRDPTYNTREQDSLQFQLSDIRALPARAGSILGWNQGIIHWGAHAAPVLAGRSNVPRISIACEFQRADVPAFETPLLDSRSPPSFAIRQKLIGKMLLRYQHMHKLTPEIERIANSLVGDRMGNDRNREAAYGGYGSSHPSL